jgi:hypothetical protein
MQLEMLYNSRVEGLVIFSEIEERKTYQRASNFSGTKHRWNLGYIGFGRGMWNKPV